MEEYSYFNEFIPTQFISKTAAFAMCVIYFSFMYLLYHLEHNYSAENSEVDVDEENGERLNHEERGDSDGREWSFERLHFDPSDLNQFREPGGIRRENLTSTPQDENLRFTTSSREYRFAAEEMESSSRISDPGIFALGKMNVATQTSTICNCFVTNNGVVETPSSVHSENTGLATWGSSASESATSTLTGEGKSTADAPPTVVLNDFTFKDSFMTAPDVDVVEGKAVKVEQAETFTQNNTPRKKSLSPLERSINRQRRSKRWMDRQVLDEFIRTASMNATQTKAPDERAKKETAKGTDDDGLMRKTQKPLTTGAGASGGEAVAGEIAEKKFAKKLVFGESAQVVIKSEPSTSKIVQNHSKKGRKSMKSLFRLNTNKTTQIDQLENNDKTSEQVGRCKKKSKIRKFFKI